MPVTTDEWSNGGDHFHVNTLAYRAWLLGTYDHHYGPAHAIVRRLSRRLTVLLEEHTEVREAGNALCIVLPFAGELTLRGASEPLLAYLCEALDHPLLDETACGAEERGE